MSSGSRNETAEDGEEESKEGKSRATTGVAADSIVLEEDLDPNYVPQSAEGIKLVYMNIEVYTSLS